MSTTVQVLDRDRDGMSFSTDTIEVSYEDLRKVYHLPLRDYGMGESITAEPFEDALRISCVTVYGKSNENEAYPWRFLIHVNPYDDEVEVFAAYGVIDLAAILKHFSPLIQQEQHDALQEKLDEIIQFLDNADSARERRRVFRRNFLAQEREHMGRSK